MNRSSSRPLVALLLLALPSAALAQGKFSKMAASGKPLWVTMKTSLGDITIELYSKDAPKTVTNFVGLATGEKEWTDPRTGEKSKKPLYDGVIFHRVIPGFMIQGGDPTGTGRGDPGYRFEDEFQSGRKFDRTGLLAMANSGPNTNGCQFFITTSTPAHLNNRHTIFGEVIAGYDVVEKISQVPRNRADKPDLDVVIKSMVVSDKKPKLKAPAKAEKQEP
jgi:peptidyl-prolyl cis-trans isomerase A (cyclophilin A)